MKKDTSRRKANMYIRFSSIGIQMGLIIFLFTWLGMYLDERYPSDKPWFTLALSLIGVIGSMVFIIRAVTKITKKDDPNKT